MGERCAGWKADGPVRLRFPSARSGGKAWSSLSLLHVTFTHERPIKLDTSVTFPKDSAQET